MAKNAWGPKLADSSNEWTGFSLNVPSVNFVLSNQDVYDYKLPYSIPTAPCCTRMHPLLFCCDVYCCCCMNKVKQGTNFMDVVDQNSGHQLRYRTEKSCCLVPRLLTFMDGQYVGHVSRTMRCFNRCRGCCEDYNGKPVLQLGLHDKDGNQLARIDRNGKGNCLYCKVAAPMKCRGCCLTCVTLSCQVKPTLSPPIAGCLNCDPVCCECCVKGERSFLSCFDLPCCCIGCPLRCGGIWCCCPSCEIKHFSNTGTIKFNDFEVLDAKTKEPAGLLQVQYRGNYPSMYMHDKEQPFKINGNTTNGLLGVLLSAVSTGLAYPMGELLPPLNGLKPKPEGTSPDFDGWVECDWAPQMKAFVGLDGKARLRDDLIVGEDMVFGTRSYGTQVKGWLLTDFGFKGAGICGIQVGKSRKPRSVSTLAEIVDIVNCALENQIGDKGVTFLMRFRLPDMEKSVIKSGENTFGDVGVINRKFNPPSGGFVDQMEEVDLTCNCTRVLCGVKDKQICCRCPCYARLVSSAKAHPSAWENPPPAVIMVNAAKKPFGEA